MKEQTLIEIKNKVESLGGVIQRLMIEIDNLKTISFGNHSLLKKLPGFEEALEELNKENQEAMKNHEESKKAAEEEVLKQQKLDEVLGEDPQKLD